MPKGIEIKAGTSWDRRDTLNVCALVALAFVLRALLAAMTPVIGGDAAAYLLFAREIGEGVWSTSLEAGLHPCFPVAIVSADALLGDLEFSGYGVSVLFSSLALVPFYALVRDIGGRRLAVLSGAFFGCLPRFILEHADIMTEGLFHFLFVTSVMLGWFGATRGKILWYAAAGLAGGLAFLTRPEGIYTPIACVGVTVLGLFEARHRGTRVPYERLAKVLLAVVLFAVVAYPLLSWIREHSGKWRVSHRPSIDYVERWVEPGTGRVGSAKTPREPGWGKALPDFGYEILKASMWMVLMAVPGIVVARRRLNPFGSVYLACLALGYSLVPLGARVTGYIVSERHLMMPVLFLLPFVSLGFLAVFERLAARGNPRRVAVAAAIVLGVLLCGMAVRAVRPRRVAYLPLKDAAAWLSTRIEADAVVHSNMLRASYYLDTPILHVPIPLEDLKDLSLGEREYVFLDEAHLRRTTPGGLEFLESRFHRAARFPAVEGEERMRRFSIFMVRETP